MAFLALQHDPAGKQKLKIKTLANFAKAPSEAKHKLSLNFNILKAPQFCLLTLL